MTRTRKNANRRPTSAPGGTQTKDNVGYGKPPPATNSSRGKAVNPKGRPKGAKSEETILRELLQQKISLNERGKARRITIHEGIFRRIIEDCLKGNTNKRGVPPQPPSRDDLRASPWNQGLAKTMMLS